MNCPNMTAHCKPHDLSMAGRSALVVSNKEIADLIRFCDKMAVEHYFDGNVNLGNRMRSAAQSWRETLKARRKAERPFFGYFRNGGIRFLRIGRLNISMSVAKA